MFAIGTIGILSISIFVTGCVPTRGNEEPLAISLRDGVVEFMWCGSEPYTGAHLTVEYEIDSGARGDRITAVEGVGNFGLERGDGFSTSVPPAGMNYSKSVGIAINTNPATSTGIWVDSGPTDTEYDFSAIYRIDNGFKKLSAGRWLFPSGEMTDSPCWAQD